MNHRLVIRPRAQTDIEDAFDYYVAEAGFDVGLRFLDGASQTFQLIATKPSLGSPRGWLNERLTGLRSWHVTGFDPYRVFYLATGETVEILRVLHGAQNTDAMIQQEN